MNIKPEKPWTAEDFHKATGYNPENDDLERINCDKAGDIGHRDCGLCEHGFPKFLVCNVCHWDLRIA